jgi:integrase
LSHFCNSKSISLRLCQYDQSFREDKKMNLFVNSHLITTNHCDEEIKALDSSINLPLNKVSRIKRKRNHPRKSISLFRQDDFLRNIFNLSKDFHSPLSDQAGKIILFRQAGEAMLLLEQTKVVRGEFGVHSYRMLVSRLNKYIYPFFGEINVREIDQKKISEFIQKLNQLNLTSITISQYVIALRKVLQYCLSQEYILKIPTFPKLKLSSTPRGGFSLQEYVLLVKTAKNLSKGTGAPLKVTHRNSRDSIFVVSDKFPVDFVWLIRFMVNSFVRPVDIKHIQHQHIQIIRGEHTYLRLQLPETKKHTGPIVTLSPAVGIYESLFKHMHKKGLSKPTDYLFFPEIKDREAAIYMIGKYFRVLLEKTNLRIGSLGQNRTLYSLRHTAITFRLLYGNGIDLLTLARNARTSVEMIERFYASNLTAEMNIGMLQSRR